MPELPTRNATVVCQTRAYEPSSTFAQRSATTAAARSTAALPVSVRRKVRSGVSRLRTHAVRPVNGVSRRVASDDEALLLTAPQYGSGLRQPPELAPRPEHRIPPP